MKRTEILKLIIKAILHLLIKDFIISNKYREEFEWVVFFGGNTRSPAMGDAFFASSLIQSYVIRTGRKICIISQNDRFSQIFNLFSKVTVFETKEDVFFNHSIFVSNKRSVLQKIGINIYSLESMFVNLILYYLNIELYIRNAGLTDTVNPLNHFKKYRIQNFFLRGHFPFAKEEISFGKPDKISYNDLLAAQQAFSNLNLIPKRTVFMNFETHFGSVESEITISQIIDIIKKSGFEYIINTKDENYKGKFNCIYLPINLLIPFSELCGNIVAWRSGFIDLLSNTNTKKIIFYNDGLIPYYMFDKEYILLGDSLQIYVSHNTDISDIYSKIFSFLSE